MSAQKPVYSRPSDDEDTLRTRYRKCYRCRKFHKDVHTTDTPSPDIAHADAKGIAKHDTPSRYAREDDGVNESFTPHEDGGVAKRDPTTTAKGDGVVERHPTTTGDHHERNRRTHEREKRRIADLRAENERLHRRLAAVYDALNLD